MALDESTLRVIILVIGAIVLALVYFWSKRGSASAKRGHHVNNRGRSDRERSTLDADFGLDHAESAQQARAGEEVMVVDEVRVIDRTQQYLEERGAAEGESDAPKVDTLTRQETADITLSTNQQDTSSIAADNGDYREQAQVDLIASEPESVSESAPSTRLDSNSDHDQQAEQQLDSTPKATSASDAPEEWTALLMVKAAESHPFEGIDIDRVCTQLEFRLNDKGLWDCYFDGEREQDPVFNIAHMKEPGTFDRATMHDLQTPGLLLFCQLPGPSKPGSVIDFMLAISGQLAQQLGGSVCDEKGKKIQQQSIIHLRSQAAEFERRLNENS